MKNRTRFTFLLAATVLATACADAITLTPKPMGQSPNGLRLIEATSEETGEDWPTRIRSAEAYFQNGIDYWGKATLIATMRYDGADASIQISSTIRESSGSILHRTHPIVEDGMNVMKRNVEHRATQELLVQSTCAAILEADVQYRAWHILLNLEGQVWEFDPQAEGRYAITRQPPCAPCPAGMTTTGSEADGGSDACTEDRDEPQAPGGGGGGGSCPECLEEEQTETGICRVRYWYKTNPFQVYAWTILWCA